MPSYKNVGLVATVYGKQATIFESMAFETAANTLVSDRAWEIELGRGAYTEKYLSTVEIIISSRQISL